MIVSVRAIWLFLGFFVFSSSALAEFSCEKLLVGERAVTAKILRDNSVAKQTARAQKIPRPDSDDLKTQAQIQQVGINGPTALDQWLTGQRSKKADMSKPGAVSYKFVGAPSPNTPDPIAVKLMEEGNVKAVHIDTNFKGRKHSTEAIVSLPQQKILNDSQYLVGSECKVVLIHLHGGGTPTAEAANGDSVAKAMAKRGVPVLALGLGGHGGATRDPRGMETFDQQAEWVLQMIENLVDPNVKIVLSGHSWGAAFAVKMRRMALDPKYRDRIKRISQFIALAPPVDVSLSGNNRMRMDFERDFEANFDLHEHKIAPADFEFQKNVLSNGKDSDIGGTFLQLTDMDYNTRPLTAEEEAMLPPETVIVGSADSLYVGKEEQFAKAFGQNLIVLGDGRTFKSPKDKPHELMKTGHQLFDLYIPGTTKTLVYTKMGDLILGGGPDLKVAVPLRDKARELTEKIGHYYANFMGFRELLEMPAYATVQTMDKSAFSLRRSALAGYVGKLKPVLAEIETLEKADPKNLAPGAKKAEVNFPGLQKAVEAHRQKFNLKGNINNVERAKEELNLPPLTPERKKALDTYISEVKKAEADLKNTFKDAIYDLAVAKLNKQYAKLLSLVGLDSVTKYESKMKDYPPKVKLEGEAGWIRSELSRLQQEMVIIDKAHKETFGIARAAKVAGIEAPAGIVDVRSANRELEADRSDEQKKRLTDFIDGFDAAVETARVAALAAAKAKLESEAKPTGIESAQQAAKELAEVEARLEYTYIPEGHEEIGIIGRQIKAYLKQVDVLYKGNDVAPGQLQKSDLSIKALEKTVDDLRKKRSAQLAQFEAFWNEGPNKEPPLISSPVVTQAKQTLDATYEAYGQLYINYQNKKGDWLLDLKERGLLTGETIISSTPELESLRQGVLKAKVTYLKTREAYENIRWVEAIKGEGHIVGSQADTRKAKEIARSIWGDDYSTTGVAGPNSLNRALRDEEEFLANRQAQVSLKERQIEMLKVEYSKRMTAIGEPMPGITHRLDLMKALNQDLDSFLAMLDRDPAHYEAFVQTVKTWEGFLAKLRSDNQTNKDSGAY